MKAISRSKISLMTLYKIRGPFLNLMRFEQVELKWEVKVKKIFFSAFLMVLGLECNAVQGADWKFFGSAILQKGENTMVYYDAESIEWLSNGNVRVWGKAVRKSDVEKILEIREEEIVEKTAEKVTEGYFPPFCLVDPGTGHPTSDAADIIAWEEAVKFPEAQVRMRILHEIRCKEKKIRNLSAIYYGDGGVMEGKDHKEGEWSYISPETNGETLRKLLCKDSK